MISFFSFGLYLLSIGSFSLGAQFKAILGNPKAGRSPKSMELFSIRR